MNFGEVCIGLSAGGSFRHNSWENGEYIKEFKTGDENDLAMIEKSGLNVETMNEAPESVVLFIDEKNNTISCYHSMDYFADTSDCWEEA